MSNLGQLIESMVDSDDDGPSDHPIDPLAQAMELRDRFTRAMRKADLKPGVLCREKRGMGFLKRDPLVMFWRWLDPLNAQDAEMIGSTVTSRSVHRVDCVIGFLDRDGDLCVIPGESWRLEPCADDPAFEEGEAPGMPPALL